MSDQDGILVLVVRGEAGVDKSALMSVAKSCPLWLQLWLQSRPPAVVRSRPRSFSSAGQAAYGTVVNRCERDHDGLAVWGSGVRVPSAPPF